MAFHGQWDYKAFQNRFQASRVKNGLRKERTKRHKNHLEKGAECPTTRTEDIGDVIEEGRWKMWAPGRARMIEDEHRIGVAEET
jgi:hypothetical protein